MFIVVDWYIIADGNECFSTDTKTSEQVMSDMFVGKLSHVVNVQF